MMPEMIMTIILKLTRMLMNMVLTIMMAMVMMPNDSDDHHVEANIPLNKRGFSFNELKARDGRCAKYTVTSEDGPETRLLTSRPSCSRCFCHW